MENQDPRTLLGYRLYWKRIAMHLNLRDLAAGLGVSSVALSQFEKGDFSKLTRDQLLAYLKELELTDKAEEYLALMPQAAEA
jgi:transcriptional regulator with XRE-family HTH domain